MGILKIRTCQQRNSKLAFKRRNSMKSTKILALMMWSIFGVVPGLHAACSTASIAGRFGFTTTGSIPGVGQVAATGIFTQDVSGNSTGTQTRSLNGSVADETFTGTATVNSDCTGTDTIQVFQDGSLVRTTTLHVVYDDKGREARAIFTSLVLQPSGVALPSIITIDARKLFSRETD
jgi:hypothetical protein